MQAEPYAAFTQFTYPNIQLEIVETQYVRA
jgi:hypothetical protein